MLNIQKPPEGACTDLRCVEALRGFLAERQLTVGTALELLIGAGLTQPEAMTAFARFYNPDDLYDAEIARARDDYASGSDRDIEIDDEPLLSPADEGVWVGAWAWVPFAEAEDELDEEDESS